MMINVRIAIALKRDILKSSFQSLDMPCLLDLPQQRRACQRYEYDGSAVNLMKDVYPGPYRSGRSSVSIELPCEPRTPELKSWAVH